MTLTNTTPYVSSKKVSQKTKKIVTTKSKSKKVQQHNVVKSVFTSTPAIKSKKTMSQYVELFDEFNAKEVRKDATTKEIVSELANQNTENEAFFIVDISKIVSQMMQWKKYLPRAHPFYAVKCNPAKEILRVVQQFSGCFDCASKHEIQQILNLGVAPQDIIFANPAKMLSHIKFAREQNVGMTTVDAAEELYKLSEHWPEAKVVLRIAVDDSKSVCRFSSKFGASVENCPKLIKICKELNLNLVGVSFHVGSGCFSVSAYEKALESAHSVFQMAEKEGFKLNLLDLGGGWPGTDEDNAPTFKDIATSISPIIDKLFSEEVRVIAEPGRYMAAASYTMVVSVYAKRHNETAKEDEPEFLYYINDGLYGSFNCLYFDHAKISIHPLVVRKGKKSLCTIFGPTCDALDKVAEKVYMPELEISDWLYVPAFGAYTVAAASAFNGFKTTKFHYIWKNDDM